MWSDEMVDRLTQLFCEGMAQHEVMDEFPELLFDVLDTGGVKWQDAEVDKLWRMFMCGYGHGFAEYANRR